MAAGAVTKYTNKILSLGELAYVNAESGDGTPITVTWTGVQNTVLTGLNGIGAFASTPNTGCSIAVVLLETADVHATLSAFLQDGLTRSCQLANLDGSTIFNGLGRIQQYPTLTYAGTVQQYTWTIVVPQFNGVLAGVPLVTA